MITGAKSSVFMVLCIGHIIGEYFLTNKYIVKKKEKKENILLLFSIYNSIYNHRNVVLYIWI